jgi:hypothetical protein
VGKIKSYTVNAQGEVTRYVVKAEDEDVTIHDKSPSSGTTRAVQDAKAENWNTTTRLQSGIAPNPNWKYMQELTVE